MRFFRFSMNVRYHFVIPQGIWNFSSFEQFLRNYLRNILYIYDTRMPSRQIVALFFFLHRSVHVACTFYTQHPFSLFNIQISIYLILSAIFGDFKQHEQTCCFVFDTITFFYIYFLHYKRKVKPYLGNNSYHYMRSTRIFNLLFITVFI